MKRIRTIFFYVIFVMCIPMCTLAQTETLDKQEIHWLTVEQANEQMSIQPKKVYVDIYTAWCSWCKVMEKKTFRNPEVIAYMNEHYYCIRLDAENTKPIRHMGKTYEAQGKQQALAVEWMRGQMTYPTSVFMDEQFANPQPVPGYLEVSMMETIAKYIAENKHHTTPFDQWQKEFKPVWNSSESK